MEISVIFSNHQSGIWLTIRKVKFSGYFQLFCLNILGVGRDLQMVLCHSENASGVVGLWKGGCYTPILPVIIKLFKQPSCTCSHPLWPLLTLTPNHELVLRDVGDTKTLCLHTHFLRLLERWWERYNVHDAWPTCTLCACLCLFAFCTHLCPWSLLMPLCSVVRTLENRFFAWEG